MRARAGGHAGFEICNPMIYLPVVEACQPANQRLSTFAVLHASLVLIASDKTHQENTTTVPCYPEPDYAGPRRRAIAHLGDLL